MIALLRQYSLWGPKGTLCFEFAHTCGSAQGAMNDCHIGVITVCEVSSALSAAVQQCTAAAVHRVWWMIAILAWTSLLCRCCLSCSTAHSCSSAQGAMNDWHDRRCCTAAQLCRCCLSCSAAVHSCSSAQGAMNDWHDRHCCTAAQLCRCCLSCSAAQPIAAAVRRVQWMIGMIVTAALQLSCAAAASAAVQQCTAAAVHRVWWMIAILAWTSLSWCCCISCSAAVHSCSSSQSVMDDCHFGMNVTVVLLLHQPQHSP